MFACTWFLQLIVNLICAAFQFSSPFIINQLVDFIEDGADMAPADETWATMRRGVILGALLITTQLSAYFI